MAKRIKAVDPVSQSKVLQAIRSEGEISARRLSILRMKWEPPVSPGDFDKILSALLGLHMIEREYIGKEEVFRAR